MVVRRMRSHGFKPAGNSSSNVASLRNVTGKKRELMDLINSGKHYTTEEKVRILNTSDSNIYKMTSQLKKDGLISRATSQSMPDKADDGMTLFFDSIHEVGRKPIEEKIQHSNSPASTQTPQSTESTRNLAFKLFQKGEKDVDIAIKLDISQKELFSFRKEYLHLTGSDSLCRAYEELEDSEFQSALDLIAKRKAQKISWEKFLEIVEGVPMLEYFHANYDMWKNKAEDTERKTREKENALQDLDRKIGEAHKTYEDTNSFNNMLAGRIVDKENKIKNLDETIGRKQRFIKDLEQTPLYLNIKQFAEQKVKEMCSDPAAIAPLTIDSMLDLVKENPGMSIMEDYAYNAQGREREPELRKKAHAGIQSKLEQRLKRKILAQAEKQADTKPA